MGPIINEIKNLMPKGRQVYSSKTEPFNAFEIQQDRITKIDTDKKRYVSKKHNQI